MEDPARQSRPEDGYWRGSTPECLADKVGHRPSIHRRHPCPPAAADGTSGRFCRPRRVTCEGAASACDATLPARSRPDPPSGSRKELVSVRYGTAGWLPCPGASAEACPPRGRPPARYRAGVGAGGIAGTGALRWAFDARGSADPRSANPHHRRPPSLLLPLARRDAVAAPRRGTPGPLSALGEGYTAAFGARGLQRGSGHRCCMCRWGSGVFLP